MSKLLVNHSLSPKEFAKRVGVSSSSVRRWEREGVITSVRNSSGYRLFSELDIKVAKDHRNNLLKEKINRGQSQLVTKKEADMLGLAGTRIPVSKRHAIAFVTMCLLFILVGFGSKGWLSQQLSRIGNLSDTSRINQYLGGDSFSRRSELVDVLGAESDNIARKIISNISWEFRKNNFEPSLRVTGTSIFEGDIDASDINLNLGGGTVIASNVIYSLSAGSGITITGGQNPTISALQTGFSKITVGSTDVTADSSTGSVTLKVGGSVSLSTSGSEITISASDTTYTAGGDLYLSGSAFALESTLDSVSTINFPAGSKLTGTDTTIDFTSFDVTSTGATTIGSTLTVTGATTLTGDLSGINGVAYAFPSAQGAIGSVLTNSNGAGTLTWASASGTGAIGYWTRTGTNLLPTTAGDDLYLSTNQLLGVGYDPSTIIGGVAAFSGNIGIGTTAPNDALDVAGSVDVSGTYKINSETIVDYTAGNSLFLGDQAGISTSGNSNILIGYSAGKELSTSENVGIGSYALYSTTGSQNVAVGYTAMYDPYQNNASNSVALGYQAMYYTGGSSNIAIGASAMWSGTGGGNYNIALGNSALDSVRGIVNSNIAIGSNALSGLDTGDGSIGIGYYSGFRMITGFGNTFLGYDSGRGTTWRDNSSNNTAIGYQSGYSMIDNSSSNIFLGYQAGYNETGSNKLYIENSNAGPNSALIYGDFSTDTLTFNANVGIGTTAPTALLHLGIGSTATVGQKITLASGATANAFEVNSSSGVGGDKFVILAGGNVGVGTTSPDDALDVVGNIDTSTYYEQNNIKILGRPYGDNLVIGNAAPNILTSSYWNIFIGDNAGINLSANADSNVYIGESAGYFATTGDSNTYIGSAAGPQGNTSDGDYNTGLGSDVLQSIEGGDFNTAVGGYASYNLTSGSRNVSLGSQAGQGIVTGSYNISLGNDTNNTNDVSSSIVIGYNNNATVDRQLVIGSAHANGYLTEGYFGSGVTDISPADFIFNVSGGSGTNNAGANMILAAGKGTGSATGGYIAFSTADAGSTGTTLQSLSEKMRLTTAGNLGIGTTAPDDALDVVGEIDTSTFYKLGGSKILDVENSRSLLVGINAGSSITSGDDNILIGYNAGSTMADADGNIAIGSNALSSINNAMGSDNVAVGLDSLKNTTNGWNNAGFGWGTLQSNTSGSDNTALGTYAGYGNNNADNNVSVGSFASNYNQTGSNNTAVGALAGYGVNTNSYANNSLFGYRAGYALTTGSNNILTGYQAGDNITTGANNIIIGYDLNAPSATANNQLYIGGIIYGDTSIGNVGIGTTAPTALLHLGIGSTATVGQKITLASGATANAFEINSSSGVGGDKFVILAGGNVGIGVTSPNDKLDVAGEIDTSTFYKLGNQKILDMVNTDSLVVGHGAGALLPVGANKNTLVGYNAGTAINSAADNNTLLGYYAGTSLTDGLNNTFLGSYAGSSATSLSDSVAIGFGAMENAGNSAQYNVAIGDIAGYQVDSLNNVLIGSQAGSTLTDGGYNTFIGTNAGASNNIGTNNVALGYNAGGLAGSYSVFLGNSAGLNETGSSKLYIENSNAGPNSALIYGDFSTDTLTFNANVGIGTTAPTALLHLGIGSTATVGQKITLASGATANAFEVNTSSGVGGDKFVIQSDGNVGIGTTAPNNALDVVGEIDTSTFYKLGNSKILDVENTGTLLIGQNAAPSIVSGADDNTVVGFNAGFSLNNAGADDNTLIGSDAGYSLTSGMWNTFLGSDAGYYSTGEGNIAIGMKALIGQSGLTTGTYNTAISSEALRDLTTGYDNVALGYRSGFQMSDSNKNTLIGNYSGENILSNGNENVAVGYYAGDGNATGDYNTYLGAYSGTNNGSSKSYGLALGYASGVFANYAMTIGPNSGNNYDSSIVIGYNANTTATNQLVLGSSDANGYLTQGYFGSGVTDISPADFTFNVSGGSGTDNAGANMILAAGKGTGNAAGGYIAFSTADVGSTGTTLQTLSEKMRIDVSGNFGIGTTAPTALLHLGIGSTATVGQKITLASGATANAFEVNTSSGVGGDLIVINSSGNLGIGTTAPASTLVLDKTTENTLRFDESSTLRGMFGIVGGAGQIITGSVDNDMAIRSESNLLFSTGGSTEKMRIDTNGNVGIGTTNPAYALDVKSSTTSIARFNGINSTGCTLSDGGVIACSSDLNLKKNITESSFGLDAVMALRPVEFNWKTNPDGTPKNLGFIAQDVELIIPKLVSIDPNGNRELNTIGLVPVLTKGLQEQQQQLNILQLNRTTQEIQLASQDNMLSGLSTEIQSLKDYVGYLDMSGDITQSQDPTIDVPDTIGTNKLSLSEQITNAMTEIYALKDQMVSVSMELSILKNNQEAGVASFIDQDQVASISASLAMLKTDIEILKSQELTASTSALLAQTTSDTLDVSTSSAKLDEFIVSGDTNLNNLAVTGKISTGLLTINGFDNSLATPSATISTLAGPLKIQDTGFEGVTFVGDKVEIDTNGDFAIRKGDLEIEKGVIKGNDQIRRINLAAKPGSKYLSVTFDTVKDTDEYAVSITPNWLTNVAVVEKQDDGFVIQFSVDAPAGGKIDWIVIE